MSFVEESGLYLADGPTTAQLIEEHDDTLFNLLLHCKQHMCFTDFFLLKKTIMTINCGLCHITSRFLDHRSYGRPM